MSGTYVTDITHYLDEVGELSAELPSPARKLASFLILLIDAVTKKLPIRDDVTGTRCRTINCTGSIVASLLSPEEEIVWQCPKCGHHGVIRNWQGTKWDGHSDRSRIQ